jgi:Zn-dependent protease with chaperone function
MNFFQSQDKARRRTGVLLLLFLLAVLSLIALTQVLLMAALLFHTGADALLQNKNFWHSFSWPTLGLIAAGITSVIGCASLYKMSQISAGGSAIAALLEGALLDRSSNDMYERKILNVVEEMAIASGVPVPQVYIIEDVAINAFAAGHDVRDVAIVITRGCIQLLNRDELQGVIAHEFSHIFNGDMNINLRLIGVLHGILFIGLIGRALLDQGDRRHWLRRDSKSTGPLMLLGLGLVIIGYCGTFFGNLIKAAISRQREFLADASAVQYTRNPAGIAGALKKIGGYTYSSAISHPNSAQLSHLFFACGIHTSRWSFFATHPELEDRITAIEPHWNDGFYPIDESKLCVEKSPIDPARVEIVNGEIQYTPAQDNSRAPIAVAATVLAQASVAAAIDAVGAPSSEHIRQAQHSLNALPAHLLELARTPHGARALVHCLLLDGNADAHQQHLDLLRTSASGSVFVLCEKVLADVEALAVPLRLPLIDLCLPTLKTLGQTEQTRFMNTVMTQIKADGRVSLFEWALYRLLRQHLEPTAAHGGQQKLAALADNCHTVLSALALSAHTKPATSQQQFLSGWLLLGLPDRTLDFTVLDNMAKMDAAVRDLHKLQPLAKPRFLKACCAAICDNGVYAAEAVELLRAIADSIDTPIPPIITTIQTAL